MTRVSIFLMPVALVVGMAGFDGVGGALSFPPSQNSPSQNLEIWTWYDLDAVRNNLAGNHTLMNDLDSTTAGYDELAGPTANQGKGWEPIGFVSVVFWDSPCGGGGSRVDWYGLNGTFDGQGHEIRDLFINRPFERDVGLFGAVDEGGVIKDIGTVNVTVIGEYYVGGLVGRNRGAVSNSYSTGSVTGDWYVGGLAGINDGGTVSNSYSIGNVTGNEDVGGLVGINDRGGTVSNSFWDIETSGQPTSDGGTGKTTAEMQDIATFTDTGTEGLDEPWHMTAVAPGETNDAYTWNIVDNETYPFLSWQAV